jgi:hypothetical protein
MGGTGHFVVDGRVSSAALAEVTVRIGELDADEGWQLVLVARAFERSSCRTIREASSMSAGPDFGAPGWMPNTSPKAPLA